MGFLDELQSRFLPGDGAMGTMLLESGAPADGCLEELCVSAPEEVSAVHAAYVAAGARVIRTNSFGANAVRLERHGLQHRVNEINWTAAKLARDAARGQRIYVAGSVGPLGPGSTEGDRNRKAIFQEQIGALLDGGVDLILFETFQDLEELAIAVEVKYSLHHCPAIASFAWRFNGPFISGTSAEEAWVRLADRGADALGLNCIDSGETLQLVERTPPGTFLSAYPSAGLPVNREGRLEYPLSPLEFAIAARKIASRGVHLIGGCCGTRPEHIAALAETLAELNAESSR